MRIRQPEGEVTIAVVGKYTNLLDSYKSLDEALTHGGIAHNVRVQPGLGGQRGLRAATSEAVERLEGVHGILVPGGFGERGTPGKIEAVRFARERSVPFFGICFGMQMAVIEAARNLVGLRGRLLHRVRPLRGAGGRPADRMDARQRAGAAQRRRRPRRHHAPRRLPGAARRGLAGARRSMAAPARSPSATATATR